MSTSVFPLQRSYLLLLCIYFHARVKVFSLFLFIFLCWKASCGEEISRHICPVGYEWAWVIIVDVTLEVNTLGGETISPYLSMCPVECFAHGYEVSVSNHRRLYACWVCGLAKRLWCMTLPENMMNCSCKVDWEHSLLVFNRVYALYFDVVMICYLFMRSYMINVL